MGRSNGCFKIIACGSNDPVDRDDLDASQSKGTDKRGWSFRKRSASHRVLSNTVITETPSGNKQSPELTAASFQAPPDSSVSKKTSEILWAEESPRLSISAPKAATVSTLVKETAAKDDTLVTKAAIADDNLVTEAAIENDTFAVQAATEDDTLVTENGSGNDISIDVNTDESAIVIQTAVRKFLAQRALVKHGKVVKLQAAVRGHLVRRHAVGTLRCVQAIVKMQALVRARQSRISPEERPRDADYDIKLAEMKNVSVEKLLNNNFARQLLESTPRTKQINLKLDPSKPDSAWKWLERWMSASATKDEQTHKLELNTEFEEQTEYIIPSEEDKLTAAKSDVEGAAVPCESKENYITHEESILVEPPQHVNTCTLSSEDPDLFHSEIKRSDGVNQVELKSLSEKPILEADEPNRSMKRLAPEQADSDGRKFGFGSRKASNPAFIAAQSKFKELTSTNNSSKSYNLSSQDRGVVDDSCVDTLSSSHDDVIKTREVDLSENIVSHKVHVAGSECGTELSISSTLDSPDRSEIEIVEFETEPKVLEEQIGNSTVEFETEPKVLEEQIDSPTDNLNTEEKLEQTILGTELTHCISVPPENLGSSIVSDNEAFKPVTNGDVPQEEYKLEDNEFNSTNQEPEAGHQVYKSSSETSPRSHKTVPESQGTPASQVSTSTKKIRSDKNTSSQKRKSLSANKRSPINTGLDSGLRSSMEQLPKDNKTAKRRNSFGSPNQEPRDSSSSNSLPSYMQATESARAKALAANGSPRSSPDVHDKENFIKKKLSPGPNGRQGSPHIQRSTSQAQPSTKGTSTNEKKWQR